ncbi:MAG: arylsulfatase A [Arcticibacterium sp.]
MVIPFFIGNFLQNLYNRMMNKNGLIICIGLLCVVLSSCREDRPPNIVYVLADDLGIGDVSIYNLDGKIKTPHIDEIATGGMRFTDAHSGSAVCTPTRYGILTGRYSWRGSMKSGVTWSYDSSIIERDRMTVASMLQTAGYETACIGKWHLGLDWVQDTTGKWPVDFNQKVTNGPLEHGFDYFYGIPASLDIPPYVYVENDRVTAQPDKETENTSDYGWWRKGPTGSDFDHETVLQQFSERSARYIKDHKEEPFFLYLPLSAPHTPILPDAKNKGKSGLSEYGDFVMTVDDVIGNVLAALKENGLEENTLIFFASDNGCAPYAGTVEMEKMGHYSSLNYRGYKAEIYEGGHRIPFMVKWPNQIRPNSVSNETVCLTDLMATVAHVLNVNLPDNAGEDSYDISPVLIQDKLKSSLREATVHHSMDGSFAIRKDNWKLILTKGTGGWKSEALTKQLAEAQYPYQLYDLTEDVGEKNNLYEQNQEKVEELWALLKDYVASGRSTPGKDQPYVKTDQWPGMEWMN